MMGLAVEASYLRVKLENRTGELWPVDSRDLSSVTATISVTLLAATSMFGNTAFSCYNYNLKKYIL